MSRAKKNLSLDVTDLGNFLYDMSRCIKCKNCYWVDHIYMPGMDFSVRCPSMLWKEFDAYGAFGKMRIGLAIYEKRLKWTDKLLEILYACTLCGACDVGCKRNLDLEIELTLEALRVKAVKDNVAPLPPHKKLVENIMNTHNRFGFKNDLRKKLDFRRESGNNADILYFVGCSTSLIQTDILRAISKLLAEARVRFAFFDEEWCCGNIVYSVGMVEEAKKIAKRNVECVQSMEAKTVLFSCAECYRMWKVDYPKILGISTEELGFRVIHLIEFVYDAINKGSLRLNKKVDAVATYHDSCGVSRLCDPYVSWSGKRGWMGTLSPPLKRRRGTHGLYLETRTILNRIPGLKLVEMPRTRENALCCGAGRGTKEAFPQFTDFVVKERIKEVRHVGAEILVSSCPWCKSNFKSALANENIEVMDISEILALSIG